MQSLGCTSYSYIPFIAYRIYHQILLIISNGHIWSTHRTRRLDSSSGTYSCVQMSDMSYRY